MQYVGAFNKKFIILDIRALSKFIHTCINWQRESINYFKLLPYKTFLFISAIALITVFVGGEYIFGLCWISP